MSPATPAFARPRIVAHRGASHDAPENTLAAFRRAWAHGVEAVELDVHVTSDGHAVVLHDPTTKRVGDRELVVANHTLAELAEVDVGVWKGPQFAGERIPTLEDAMATMAPGGTLFVEIKSGAATVPVVAATIRDARPSNATILLQGYDPDVLASLAAAVPDAGAYWTVDPQPDGQGGVLPYPRALIDETRRRGFVGLALMASAVDDGLLAAAVGAGLLVDVWTLNDAAQIAAWGARDVRWIETDRPDLAPVAR